MLNYLKKKTFLTNANFNFCWKNCDFHFLTWTNVLTKYELSDVYVFLPLKKPCFLMKKSGITFAHDFSSVIPSVYTSSCAGLN